MNPPTSSHLPNVSKTLRDHRWIESPNHMSHESQSRLYRREVIAANVRKSVTSSCDHYVTLRPISCSSYDGKSSEVTQDLIPSPFSDALPSYPSETMSRPSPSLMFPSSIQLSLPLDEEEDHDFNRDSIVVPPFEHSISTSILQMNSIIPTTEGSTTEHPSINSSLPSQSRMDVFLSPPGEKAHLLTCTSVPGPCLSQGCDDRQTNDDEWSRPPVLVRRGSEVILLADRSMSNSLHGRMPLHNTHARGMSVCGSTLTMMDTYTPQSRPRVHSECFTTATAATAAAIATNNAAAVSDDAPVTTAVSDATHDIFARELITGTVAVTQSPVSEAPMAIVDVVCPTVDDAAPDDAISSASMSAPALDATVASASVAVAVAVAAVADTISISASESCSASIDAVTPATSTLVDAAVVSASTSTCASSFASASGATVAFDVVSASATDAISMADGDGSDSESVSFSTACHVCDDDMSTIHRVSGMASDSSLSSGLHSVSGARPPLHSVLLTHPMDTPPSSPRMSLAHGYTHPLFTSYSTYNASVPAATTRPRTLRPTDPSLDILVLPTLMPMASTSRLRNLETFVRSASRWEEGEEGLCGTPSPTASALFAATHAFEDTDAVCGNAYGMDDAVYSGVYVGVNNGQAAHHSMPHSFVHAASSTHTSGATATAVDAQTHASITPFDLPTVFPADTPASGASNAYHNTSAFAVNSTYACATSTSPSCPSYPAHIGPGSVATVAAVTSTTGIAPADAVGSAAGSASTPPPVLMPDFAHDTRSNVANTAAAVGKVAVGAHDNANGVMYDGLYDGVYSAHAYTRTNISSHDSQPITIAPSPGVQEPLYSRAYPLHGDRAFPSDATLRNELALRGDTSLRSRTGSTAASSHAARLPRRSKGVWTDLLTRGLGMLAIVDAVSGHTNAHNGTSTVPSTTTARPHSFSTRPHSMNTSTAYTGMNVNMVASLGMSGSGCRMGCLHVCVCRRVTANDDDEGLRAAAASL